LLYLRQVTTKGLLSSGFRTCLKANQQLDPIHLPDGPGRNALADDIYQLSVLYHDLPGCSMAGLRLEVLHNAMCPRFHVDRTGIRMTCTYLGPGTEWIDDVQVDRTRLGRGANGLPDTQSGLFTTDEIDRSRLLLRCSAAQRDIVAGQYCTGSNTPLPCHYAFG